MLYHRSITKTTVILIIYNLSSCSVYFISTMFFIPHLESGDELINIFNFTESGMGKMMTLIAIIGFLVMFYSQFISLYEKARNIKLFKKNNSIGVNRLVFMF